MKISESLKDQILIAGAGIVAYIVSIFNDFHTDDWVALASLKDGFSWNEIFSLTNARNFRPLTNIFGYLRYLLFGSHPSGYYLLNIALHVVVCILLYRFLKILKFSRLAAFLSSVIFAAYFQHYEAVLLIFGVGRILAAIFCLLSLMALYDYIITDRTKSFALFAIFSLLGFATVEDFWISAIGSTIFVLIMSDKIITIKKPLLVAMAGAANFMICLGLRSSLISDQTIITKNFHPGFHMFRNLIDYLGWLIIPSPDHEYFQPIVHSLWPALYWIWEALALISVAVIISVFIYLLIKFPRPIKFFVIFVLLTLIPALPFTTKVASRYIYIPSIGLAAIWGYLLSLLLKKLETHSNWRKVVITSIIASLMINIAAIAVTSAQYRKTQGMVRSMVEDVRDSKVDLSKYQLVLLDHLPGRAAPGSALWYYFGFNVIIASNDAINGPIDIPKAAADLTSQGKLFVVFDYQNGHLKEATKEYIAHDRDDR